MEKQNHDIQVLVDPMMFPWACSYFLYGLYEIFGKQNVKFDINPFLCLSTSPARGNTFNFVVSNRNIMRKYSIDWFDINDINNKEAYDWCDVYGKVNTNWNVTPPTLFPKVVSIGPTFGIHVFSIVTALKLLCYNIYYSKKYKFSYNIIKNLHYFYRESHRAYIYIYNSSNTIKDNYIFWLSTLWYNASWNNNDENLNTPRYKLIKECSRINWIHFKGGFVAHNKRNISNGYKSSIEKYSDVIWNHRVSVKKYIENIKTSFAVINTPAVVSCHGWKLGEYLALGKAIVSLPLVNELPSPLVHGVHIHYIEDKPGSLTAALEYIHSHPEYRHKLEIGARQYWEQYCSPTQIINTLMNFNKQ